MEYARHRLPGALRFLQSSPGHLGNELVVACSPLDSQDAPSVVLDLVVKLLGNLEEVASSRACRCRKTSPQPRGRLAVRL